MECCSERVSLDRTSKRRRLNGHWNLGEGVHVEREGLPSIHNLSNPLYTFNLSWPGSSTIRRSISVDLHGEEIRIFLHLQVFLKRRVYSLLRLSDFRLSDFSAFTDHQWGQWLKIVSAIFLITVFFQYHFLFLSPPL